MPRYAIQREWVGETVIGIAGGESVREVDLSVLKGRKVIVVNSSYRTYPEADWLIFTDDRWWKLHRKEVRATFKGRILTITPDLPMYNPDVHVVTRMRSSGASKDPSMLACWHTTLTTANNFMALAGAAKLGWLGADGEGDWHHEPHPAKWRRHPRWPYYHAKALEIQVEPLKQMGLQVFNLNPNSKFRMFPFTSLEEFLV